MSRLRIVFVVLSVMLAAIALCTATSAGVVGVRFWSNGRLVCVGRTALDNVPLMESAVRSLVAGPTKDEAASGMTSRIPAGVVVLSYSASGDTVQVDLSSEVLTGLDEAGVTAIFDQFRSTIGDFPSITAIKLTCNGKTLASYLPPAPSVGAASASIKTLAVASTTGLAGKKITIGPSHGWYSTGGGWDWQRTEFCGLGEQTLEDTNSIRLCQFLKQYLMQDGATVSVARQLDESDGIDPETGLPWWKMCASSWLHHLGYPATIWAAASQVDGDDLDANRYSDDIRARPLFADNQGSDIYIAHHTNDGGGTGTETFRDSQMEHPSHIADSLNLATQVQNSVVNTIRELYDSAWVSRGVKDSAAGFGEIRIPDRPACLIELGFHDNCSRDAPALADDFFRSLSEWAIYNGVCTYFGTTPTWDKYSCELVSENLPDHMTAGQTYTATIKYVNRGVSWFTSRGFRLGVPNGADPFTHCSRIDIDGEVRPGQDYSFTLAMTAPSLAGQYAVSWQMVRDGCAWFGPVVRKTIVVDDGAPAPPDETGSALGGKTFDWESVPTSSSVGWTATSQCGYPSLYTSTETADCTNVNRELKWQSVATYSGRGHATTEVQVPCVGATVNAKYTMMKSDGSDEGTIAWLDQCGGAGWRTLYDADRQDLDLGGWRINTNDIQSGASCDSTCGNRMLGAAGLHMYGDRWQYIDDWSCLGAFSSTQVSDTHSFDEASLYLYPAVDRTHGDVLLYGGKAAGRVTTGDCNNANTLDFKGNASDYGADNSDGYGFAWVYSPSGATPKFLIGSADGNRVWVNGALVNDNNTARSLTRDQDETDAVTLPAGWSRVLFKVHSGTGDFAGTMSLRTGTDKRWNEQGVNLFDMGGYRSYGLGYEQDSWYPRIDVDNFDGLDNPAPGDRVYTNNTTITARGITSAYGPIPVWKVMYYANGYGLGGIDTNYLDVTSSGTAWSHTQTGVYGHRRYYFFAVSQSHRTSFQSGVGSGKNGGSNWADGGPGNYMDVYVDAIAPMTPSISTVTAVSPNEIDAAWAIPLDRGHGIGLGATEGFSGDGYRCGDVGVSVRRNGSVIMDWSNETSINDSGLTPNTKYTYDIAARDNHTHIRGSWNNTTTFGGSKAKWTLSVPPSADTITCNRSTKQWLTTTDFTFTAVGGFGTGTVDHYIYAWDKNATHTFTGSETTWNSGTITQTASSEGSWYLHIKGFNGEGVANGTVDLGPYDYGTPATVDTISAAFGKADGEPLTLLSKPVTAALPGMFWIEETKRTSAVKVLSSTAVTVGHSVNVTGSLGMSGVERVLFADDVADQGQGELPSAVFIDVRNLGGAAFNSSTPGVTTTSGLYNIGMLVRIAGTVSYLNTSDASAKFFYVDDGSGSIDGSGHMGVKVLCRDLDTPISSSVIVTGVVSGELAGSKVAPVIIVRDGSDITPVP